MAKFKILKSASFRLDEIYIYSVREWGLKQAQEYISSMFNKFQSIADKKTHWNVIPAEFNVRGYYVVHKKHFIYFKEKKENEVAIMAIILCSMDRLNKLKKDTF